VRWDEMSGFGIKKQIGVPFIIIYLKDKNEFIDRFSGLKKATIKKMQNHLERQLQLAR
jgi:hypothetical protein